MCSITPKHSSPQVNMGPSTTPLRRAADTIEELATKAGLPKDTLAKTVNRYNELVEKGIDEDYGVDPKLLKWNAIKEPPFYAVAYWPNVYTIGVGLVCNEDNQVINTDDEPIKGLYAAGNAGGSFFGYYYPVSGFSAAGVSHALVGPLAAAAALGKTLDDKLPTV